MRNITSHILIFLLFWMALPGSLTAQTDSVMRKTEVPDYRYPSVDRMDDFRASEDFQYLDQAAPGNSLWDRFWAFVQRVINYLFAGESADALSLFMRLLVYGLMAFVIGFAIYRLVQIRSGGISRQAEPEPLAAGLTEENIHELDFNALIEEAVSNNNWRLAIRLRYLQTLKLLSDRDLIDWEPWKTNHEYSTEIGSAALRNQFERISYFFDYAWYGEFSVDESHYRRVGSIYQEMSQTV